MNARELLSAGCRQGRTGHFSEPWERPVSSNECTGMSRQNTTIQQDFWCRLFSWRCIDECKYHCMWSAVKKLENAGRQVVKFHGKWPFKRIMGMQEPASVFASLLNLLANAYMYSKLRTEFSIKSRPMVLLWHLFALVCMNAWVWSMVFHTRDTPFTEFMDYTCALSMVMGLYVAAVVRILHSQKKIVATLLTGSLLYFATHVRLLATGVVDYDYNMTVNVIFGAVGSFIWLVYAGYLSARGSRYSSRMLWFVTCSAVVLPLELLDFPPVRRAWDAHAVWHLSTAPLPLLFYQFVIEDLRYTQSRQDKLL
ncbi:post-GPI attachment to proteins factor 3 isoform X4 [Bombyx mori]|uniref:Post-GPI attachment to proteins factor 3 n=1 Tax=Bombyx mori TaxID=7091 RepID=A0A8R2R060_BOMMO|nr:post-GPI attachment to proteins factor 3 isoform X4 [Bombyx mori]XP_037869096.1 post-GPI attachment to proteins factor 3 isoform X4 [Bombyx mori]